MTTTAFFLTTHNTDFSELRGWPAPDGIWSTERRALGGMRDGAYLPGQGVDVRSFNANEPVAEHELGTRVTVGQYFDAFGRNRTGFVPANIVRATPEEKAEFEMLEKALGRSSADEQHEAWLHAMAEARTENTRIEPRAQTVWLSLLPVKRSIGSRTISTWVISGVYTNRLRLDIEMGKRRENNPSAPPAVAVEVPVDTRFDIDGLAQAESAVREPLPVDPAVKAAGDRYAELTAALGL